MKHPSKKLYAQGRRREWKARDILIEQGYYVMRSAGSKGVWDLIAIGKDIILIQAKSDTPPSAKEMQRMRDFVVPPGVRKELWMFRYRKQVEIVPIDN